MKYSISYQYNTRKTASCYQATSLIYIAGSPNSCTIRRCIHCILQLFPMSSAYWSEINFLRFSTSSRSCCTPFILACIASTLSEDSLLSFSSSFVDVAGNGNHRKSKDIYRRHKFTDFMRPRGILWKPLAFPLAFPCFVVVVDFNFFGYYVYSIKWFGNTKGFCFGSLLGHNCSKAR